MRRGRKTLAFLVSLIMFLSLSTSQQSIFANDTGIVVQFQNGNTSTSSNTINAKFKILNTGSSPVNLATLKLRYYYTIDVEKAQNFFCDYSAMMSSNNYVDLTKKVTGAFVKMNQTTSNADYYLEVGFSSDAGSIPAGGSIELQARVAKSDWSNYDQSNDFSYKSAGSYTDWDQIGTFVNGILVFGKEPIIGTPTVTPTIVPTATPTIAPTATPTIAPTATPTIAPTATPTIAPTVTPTIVPTATPTIAPTATPTIAPTATPTITPTATPTVTPTVTPTPTTESFSMKIGTVSGNTGDTVTVPVTLNNIEKVGNLVTCNFYVTYDSALLQAVSVSAGDIITNSTVNFSSNINTGKISIVFLDKTVGNELITKDGVMANITFKIVGTTSETTPVVFKTGGTFVDGNLKKITTITKVDGSVKIN